MANAVHGGIAQGENNLVGEKSNKFGQHSGQQQSRAMNIAVPEALRYREKTLFKAVFKAPLDAVG
eukprot:CAMPEP_0195036976 /NCGR_PEP_ID=MMETSP0326_2-20130528/73860_1 /TAXON_ID=2866 ORGANISM="Crypthecodinium cohnii, Strain Seligo" /NCGR_SAMPLE_ID=MMETSP0326_2 /ASSEMBLY_ACC=CAM_ASM_000348 /LENGTH=64 /DNA_ID=CAMNT_0040062785 /DNA_START=132 /DNA_END=324 /DNA_ORIENTATION=+